MTRSFSRVLSLAAAALMVAAPAAVAAEEESAELILAASMSRLSAPASPALADTGYELPRSAVLGLPRASMVGAITGGAALGIYTAVWWGRECEGSCRAPHLQGFVIGAATGALAGAIAGGLIDYLFL